MSSEGISENFRESHICNNLKLENLDEFHNCKNLKFENFDESQLKMMRPGLVYMSCKDLCLN
jgi:hypothetical protein